jgi:Fe-S-cluster containining protein
MTTLEFTRKYTETTYGRLHLRDPEKNCLFLEDKQCKIYEVRPHQCRTWPFWPENMKKSLWEREIAPVCSGIGKGRLFSADEIEEIIRCEREALLF